MSEEEVIGTFEIEKPKVCIRMIELMQTMIDHDNEKIKKRFGISCKDCDQKIRCALQ